MKSHIIAALLAMIAMAAAVPVFTLQPAHRRKPDTKPHPLTDVDREALRAAALRRQQRAAKRLAIALR